MSDKELHTEASSSETAEQEMPVALYTTDDGRVRIDVQIEDNTVWLSQQQMAQLYGKAVSTINEHLRNIFDDEELDPQVVIRKYRNTTRHGAIEGKTQTSETMYYNLDVVIAVGLRVRSKQGTHFRQWATARLKEYIIKGFSIDSERLKGNGGGQYWYELLNTIKDIRSSEKVLYRQVLDLYATSIDYDATDQETILFFKMVQNKLHFATHGQTAAELIYTRADAEKEFMGLTNFRGSHPTMAEVVIAKNYLSETELRKLNNMVSGYFDFAENRAIDQVPTTMRDYRLMLDRILEAGGNPVLDGPGSISAQQAKDKAIAEYRKYQVRALTPVERAYIASLEQEAKSIKEKN